MSGRDAPDSYLVDSNIFLRVIVRDDQKTWQDCVGIVSAIEQNQLTAYIPMIVVAEVQFVLKSFYGLQRQSLVKALMGIAAMKNLEIVDDLSYALAVKLFADHNVKFVDCLLASSRCIQERNAAILSFDRDFDKLGVRRVEPRDLLKEVSTVSSPKS